MHEENLFLEALKIESPDQRASFLDKACENNSALRESVEALLRHHSDAGSFLEKPPEALGKNALNEFDTVAQSSGQTTLAFLGPSQNPDCMGTIGPYEVTEVVGRGGMGLVLRGFDAKLNRVVAIKVLAPELASHAAARKRFLREGQAAAAVSHDHVVTIYGIDDGDPLPFIVMEYVLGQSLQQRIDQTGPLKLEEILRIGKQTASGLAAAHAEGLIHRDIKPANILLEDGVDRVKITDFGLARAVDDVSITRSGTVAGTPQYMSPEQARGDLVDHRSDLFSLGGVLYAMCSGQPPFHADSTVAMIRRVCEEQPEPLQQINPDVPNWLAEIIDRLLEKDREERLQSAAEVADLLGRHLLHLQQPGVNAQPPSVARASRQPSNLGNAWANRRVWLTSLAATLLLAIGLGFAEFRGVTNVTQTIIRVVIGEGTLVIEVDDPTIEVEITEEGVHFKGSGQNKISVRAGWHTILGRKHGKLVYSELVSIARDRETIVRVRLEETPPVVRSQLVWQDPANISGQPSPDGRYVSYIDWQTGNLGVRDLDTATNWPLTNTNWPKWRSYPVFSPDSQQIAYQFGPESPGQFAEVWTVGMHGTESPVFANEEIGASPVAWSPKGKHILAILGVARDQEGQLALMSVPDGSVLKLKTSQDAQRPISFSPDGEYIAYSHMQQTGSDAHRNISLRATEGTQETHLIQGPADDFVLGWTPDGKELVFASDRTGVLHAFTIPIADGVARGEWRMARQLGPIIPIGFTNHGSFFHGRKSPYDNIYTAAVDVETGDVETQPTPAIAKHVGHQSAPDWSPDGKSLACRSESNQAFLVLSNGEISELVPKRRLPRNVHSLRWSPDGHSFLYADITDVLQMDIKTRKVTVLTEGRVLDADWSSDGNAVFYVDADFGGPHRIVRRRQLGSGEVTELCRIAELVLWLTVSPDGKRLALLTETEGDERAVILVPATGGEPQELLKVKGIQKGALAWTMDGQFLLYGLGAKNTELWRVAVEGGVPQKLGLKVTGRMKHLRVHPDGKQIAFLVSSSRSELWVMKNFFASLAVEH